MLNTCESHRHTARFNLLLRSKAIVEKYLLERTAPSSARVPHIQSLPLSPTLLTLQAHPQHQPNYFKLAIQMDLAGRSHHRLAKNQESPFPLQCRAEDDFFSDVVGLIEPPYRLKRVAAYEYKATGRPADDPRQ